MEEVDEDESTSPNVDDLRPCTSSTWHMEDRDSTITGHPISIDLSLPSKHSQNGNCEHRFYAKTHSHHNLHKRESHTDLTRKIHAAKLEEMSNQRADSAPSLKSAAAVQHPNQQPFTLDTLAAALRSRKRPAPPNPQMQCFLLSKREIVGAKNFSKDVRSRLDVDKFMEEAVILLRVEVESLEELIKMMLIKSLTQMKVPGYEDFSEFITANDLLKSDTHTDLYKYHVVEDQPNMEHLMFDAMNSTLLLHQEQDDSYKILAKTLQGLRPTNTGIVEVEPTWICAMCPLLCVTKSLVSIAVLQEPMNLGETCEHVEFVILVMTPVREKYTKSDLEMAKTFSTLFSNEIFRQKLRNAIDENEFKLEVKMEAERLIKFKPLVRRDTALLFKTVDEEFEVERKWPLLNGIRQDLMNKITHYPSDIIDIFRDKASIIKLISMTTFLYFATLLASIAFGHLNEATTGGLIGVRQNVLAQGIGGMTFAVIGGQPLIVLLSTAPLCLFIEVIHSIAEDNHWDFLAFFGCVGLFNSGLLIIYAVGDLSRFMKYSTRSTEEIFALFIAIAFCVDAGRSAVESFRDHYCPTNCSSMNGSHFNVTNAHEDTLLIDLSGNMTTSVHGKSKSHTECDRSISVLYLLLMFGLVWMGLVLMNFTTTPFLNQSKRQILADFALPISVILFSFIGSYLFRQIPSKAFEVTPLAGFTLRIAKINTLPWLAILVSLLLAIPLSILIFMEQNMAAVSISSPANKLKKGTAYHWDLLVVAIINGIHSVFGLPWLHGNVPHTPMHAKGLADIQEHIGINNHVTQHVVRSRETRMTTFLAHVLVGVSFFMLPTPLQYIPVPVLNGLFIFLAITSLYSNQFFERILLLFTEQRAYPPSHYIRRVPQRYIHIFTLVQILQLGGICALAFAPNYYVNILYPLLLLAQLPIRQLLIPRIIRREYADSLDHCL